MGLGRLMDVLEAAPILIRAGESARPELWLVSVGPRHPLLETVVATFAARGRIHPARHSASHHDPSAHFGSPFRPLWIQR